MQGKCKDTKILLFNKYQLTYKRNKHTNIEFEGQKKLQATGSLLAVLWYISIIY